MLNMCIWRLRVIHKGEARDRALPIFLGDVTYSIIYNLKLSEKFKYGTLTPFHFQNKKRAEKGLLIIPRHTSVTNISNQSVIQMRQKIKNLEEKCSIVSDFNFWLELKCLLTKHKTYMSYTCKEFTFESFMNLQLIFFSF